MYHLFLKVLVLAGSAFWLSNNMVHAASDDIPLLAKTVSQATQQNMTPKEALLRLKQGNQRFLSNTPIARDYLQQAKEAAYGQYPYAVVLNCMDSRSIPELFFDQGLADLFTLRIAGNILNNDILGSMEFATKAVGARLVVVLAHTSCGAVVGACKDAKLGHLTDVLDKIHPAVKVAMDETGLKNCTDPKLSDAIAKANALRVVEKILEQSPILSKLVQEQKVGIVAGMHNIKTGEVTFFDEGRSVPG